LTLSRSEFLTGHEEVSALPLGSILIGRYRVDTILAVGSMGTVYGAADLLDNEAPRAIKELLPFWSEAEEQAEAEAWFLREGETLRGLDHPAIPRIHDTLIAGRRHYLVMDLIEGETLEQGPAKRASTGLEEPLVLTWADQVLDVLSYLHGRPSPVIFRDLKPANLMLTPEGRIHLIDFGIARVFSRQSKGTAIGTPGYAPPEQYQGLAEPASDLYALGATMHHLLTGRDPRNARPFDFPPVARLAPRISPHVASAIDRALVLDPRRRFDTASDMYRALHAPIPLANLPRLTQGRNQLMPIIQAPELLTMAARIEVVINMVDEPAPANAVLLPPGTTQITHGGITLVVPPDGARLELHNHTNERLSCAFSTTVPWLDLRLAGAWLEPHGMLDILVDRSASSAALLPTSGALIPSVRARPPIYLLVRGLAGKEVAARLTILPGVAPFSIVAGSSALAILIVVFAHLSILAFYAMEVPALALAVWIQRRSRGWP
jgi:hypothetical protein